MCVCVFNGLSERTDNTTYKEIEALCFEHKSYPTRDTYMACRQLLEF